MTIPLFDPNTWTREHALGRIGRREAGPLAADLVWAEALLDGARLHERFPSFRVEIAPTVFLTEPPGAGVEPDRATLTGLHAFIARERAPLRIASDARHRAGSFSPDAEREWILPNDRGDAGARVQRLVAAVRSCVEADAAERRGPADPGSEPVILLQPILGNRREDRYYPDVSGILLSENHYPVSYLRREDGIAYVALGLGYRLRASMQALRFSPAYPDVMPDFSTPKDVLKHTQRRFHAVDLSGSAGGSADGQPAAFGLDVALADGTLAPVGGVVSLENQIIYPGVHRPGVRVVTFAQLLKSTVLPLPAVLSALLEALREGSPVPFAVRFALSLSNDPGRGDPHRLVVERVERMARPGKREEDFGDPPTGPTDVLCRSESAMGDGEYAGIHDVVYVPPDRFDRLRSAEMAREIAALNARLTRLERPYALVGPGRWGTAERSLGVPVLWTDIAGAHVIVEAGIEGFDVEYSRGTHFFRELTYHDVGYLHVNPQRADERIDWQALAAAPVESEGAFSRHVTFESPLWIYLDGRSGRGVIRKPGP
jgi:hypothetical protein